MLEEVIVTARKRSENLQDVPISIDVFTSKDLQNLAISQFEDYATMTPSISFVSAGPATQTFVMRGVSDGSNPNYPNDSHDRLLGRRHVDELLRHDSRFALLRYRAHRGIERPAGNDVRRGAMAGALRFITNKPDPTAFSAGIDLDGGKIDGGTSQRHGRGFVNLPSSPTGRRCASPPSAITTAGSSTMR